MDTEVSVIGWCLTTDTGELYVKPSGYERDQVVAVYHSFSEARRIADRLSLHIKPVYAEN